MSGKTFKNYCTCGGYARQMNGRDPEQPHADWCPQRDEYAAWQATQSGAPVRPTGREPELLQDCDRKLSRALASKPDARMHAREAAAFVGQPLTREPQPLIGATETVFGATDRVQMPEKARAGIEVLHRVVESLLTTGRYVDEEGEATQALADLSACIADPPFRLAGSAVVDHGLNATPVVDQKPANLTYDMVLFCPKCGTQHIDAPETDAQYTEKLHESSWWELGGEKPQRWTNPPHRSHLCHSCGCVWRPADVTTNGVREVKTRGKADTWPARAQGASEPHRVSEPCQRGQQCIYPRCRADGCPSGVEPSPEGFGKVDLVGLKRGPIRTPGMTPCAPAPVAWVPIHPRNGPLWSMTTDKPNAERLPASYPLRPLVFADGVAGVDDQTKGGSE